MPDKALAEEQRLAALYALELLDTARCERFDRICGWPQSTSRCPRP
ncbi:hypothetical protein PBOI14_17950 [Pseudomonas sp. Boi14]|nr:hypothetical protein PBOI14_17950 [Pseudomonas sp. Boi14]